MYQVVFSYYDESLGCFLVSTRVFTKLDAFFITLNHMVKDSNIKIHNVNYFVSVCQK